MLTTSGQTRRCSRMVVPERRAKIPSQFVIWKPRIPSVYGRGFERAKNTRFALAVSIPTRPSGYDQEPSVP